MLAWAEGFDAQLRHSNQQTYDVCDSKLYSVLLLHIDIESQDAAPARYAVMNPNVVNHGRRAVRALMALYQPDTMAEKQELLTNLSTLSMEGRSPAALFGEAKYLRAQLQSHGVVVGDDELFAYCTKAIPSTPTYQVVLASLRCQARIDLEESQRQLQAQFDAECAEQAAALRVGPMALATQTRGQQQEQQHSRVTEGPCFYCNEGGHRVAACKLRLAGKPPVKGSVVAKRKAARAAATKKGGGKGAPGPRAFIAVPEEVNPVFLAQPDPEGSRASSNILAAAAATQGERAVFTVDSGATEHLIDPLLLGFEVTSIASSLRATHIALETASSSATQTWVEQVGTVHFTVPGAGGVAISMANTHMAEGSGQLLLSVPRLVAAGGQINMQRGKATMLLPGSPPVHVPLKQSGNGLFQLELYANPAAARTSSTAATAAAAVSTQLWHERLGHVNLADLKKLAAMEGSGVVLPQQELDPCSTCMQQKARRQPHAPAAITGVPGKGCKWHSDTTALFEVKGKIYNGTCARVFQDQATRFVVVYSKESKAHVEHDVNMLREDVLAPEGIHLEHLHLDGAGEHMAAELEDYSRRAGIKITMPPPHCPQSNGMVERTIGVLQDSARSMLASSGGFGSEYWELALLYAGYVYNRTPRAGLGGITPYEAWISEVPDLSKLRKFGAHAFVCDEYRRGKLTAKAWRGRFVGISRRHPGSYLIFNEKTGRVIATHHVTFIEAPAAPAAAAQEQRGGAPAGEGGIKGAEGAGAQPVLEPEQPDQPEPEPEPEQPERGNATRSGRTYGPTAAAAAASLLPPEPRSYQEATAGPEGEEWTAAARLEWDQLVGKGTWEECERSDVPDGERVLNAAWTFVRKLNAQGEVERYKARFVARGDQQRPGVDYEHIFAPTASVASVRMVVALAVEQGWDLRAGDIANAFANADIDKETYVAMPPGFKKIGSDGRPMVLRLKKSLYGLHQSPRLWHKELSAFLQQHGFEACVEADCCVLYNKTSGVVLVVYVDDILATGTADGAQLRAVFELIASRFEMKDLGFPSKFLGINFKRAADGGITLVQDAYINTLLERFSMADAHPVHTPMATDLTLGLNSPLLEAEPEAEYKRLVGSLQWLATCTRLDISYTVSQLQQRMQAPRQCDMAAARRALAYLKGHPIGITYRRTGAEVQLVGYADASYASDAATRRSHTGFVFTLGGAAVAWCSKKQRCVTLSTTEAEYVALCEASKEVPWLRRQLAFLGHSQGPVSLLEDNSAAIFLANDDGAAHRTKHIDVKFHYVREQVANGVVRVAAVRTDQQHADVLTKALGGERHHYHTGKLLGSV
jgi:transposase InsO family protein